jgi:multidrug efflux pump subunit AcrB
VALSQFATFSYEQELPLIWRRDRVPTLTVRADVTHGSLPESIVSELAPSIAALNADLTKPYHIATGGIVEDSAKSRASVLAVVPLMLLLTLTILMFHLKSFQRVAIVLAVVPLGVIGVVAALLLFNQPLGFVAILGILSLLGMIAKNGVILLTQIEDNRAEGQAIWAAVVGASASRVRPILLTAGSTVLGLMPIAPTVFWGPMAIAIMGGLLVASVLTLVFLPTLYVTWFRGRESDAPQSPSTAAPVATKTADETP